MAVEIPAQHRRVLELLLRRDAWMTAEDIARALAVTPRSVRNYITALRQNAPDDAIIISGPRGYRVDPALAAPLLREERRSDTAAHPSSRLGLIVRRLIDAPAGLDVFALAEEIFLSESTIETDLTRIRALLVDTELSLERQRSVVCLRGDEGARRRLISRLFRDEARQGVLELERIQEAFTTGSLSAFKTDLVKTLDALGFFVNEYGINDVLLHVAIALDRMRKAQFLPSPPEDTAPAGDAETARIGQAVAARVQEHFAVDLDAVERDSLALLLRTRVLAPDVSGSEFLTALDASARAMVAEIVARAAAKYGIDLDDDLFITRLAVHVQNLIRRARGHALSRNPFARSLKTSQPMTYELAVYIASLIQERAGIVVVDDEIAYIAMHVGAHLFKQDRPDDLLRTIIVSPNYYDIHILLRTRIERSLGTELDITAVLTTSDVDWSRLDADLIITTLTPSDYRDNIVTVQPFMTDAGMSELRTAVERVRRQRVHARTRDQLLHYFDERLFFRNLHAMSPEAMIRTLGAHLIAAGAVDEGYVDNALERERMSSTAFTDMLAVPHAMTMSAARTTIALVMNDAAMDWGDSRVTIIAFMAFAPGDREAFQSIFGRFVEVFSDPETVAEMLRVSPDFSRFIDEFARIIGG